MAAVGTIFNVFSFDKLLSHHLPDEERMRNVLSHVREYLSLLKSFFYTSKATLIISTAIVYKIYTS